MALESSKIASVLRTHRIELATALLDSLADWDKYPEAESSDPSVRSSFAGRELLASIDYLALYFERNDASYLDLYLGEKLKQCYDPGDTEREALERRRWIAATDRLRLGEFLKPLLDAGEHSKLMITLEQVVTTVTGEKLTPVRVLLVGDSIHIDAISFLARRLRGEGLRLEPKFATSKNPSELLRTLHGLDGETFDLIFFSPFSYAFHQEYSQLLETRAALMLPGQIRVLAEAAIRDTKAVLDLLPTLFHAPIFMHNSSGVRRHDGTLVERLKNLATRRARSYARRLVNEWLQAQMEQAEPAANLFLLDEAGLLQQHPGDQLGREFYHSDVQHPAELGRAVAQFYLDAIVAQVVLARKKLIVTDLDNTLWKGAIGEGAVEHLADRQQLLKKLRKHGMLLAILSKNDPNNVVWDGCVLGPDDFVASQINWSMKSHNVRKIAAELNLESKDFLFLDDRAEERAMMVEAMPEILTSDSDSPAMWRRLALVAELLARQGQEDRTALYQQRSRREAALAIPVEDAEDRIAMFRKLEFLVRPRAAGKNDLSRVVDLINRTNQFNMCDTRTTLAEAKRWLEGPAHRILVVDALDKFGSMGTVCVAVLVKSGSCLDIAAFVLSSRVFGFGVETALLNTVKRMAGYSSGENATSGGSFAPSQALVVRGGYVGTAANEPCRNVYQDHGFRREGDIWAYHGGGPIVDPEWLTVFAEPLEQLAIRF